MKINDKTTYKETYGKSRESMPQFMREHEDEMKKTCLQKMTRGSLARHVEVPFMGKSVTHETFVSPGKTGNKEPYRPIDELFVPHQQLHMITDSENHQEYRGAKVDLCKYLLNKPKAVFD